MKSAILAIALLFVGCAGTLKQHAQAASTSAQLLTGVSAAMSKEASEDYEAILHLPAEERGPKLDVVAAQHERMRSAYRTTVAALKTYRDEIREADKAGKKTLGSHLLQELRDSWRALVEAGDVLGIAVPPLPEKLEVTSGS